MKTLALSSAIVMALGVSAAAYADRGHNDPKFLIDDSFNRSYSLDYTKNLDLDYKLDIGVAVAASVLTGTVVGNQGSQSVGSAWEAIKARTNDTTVNQVNGTHTTGIAAIAQSTGSNNLNQQSAVVQANFKM